MESEEICCWDASDSISAAPSELESTVSSRCSSIISYEYNPDDFPKACEIEEFQSPSFEWPSTRSLSRSQIAERTAPIQYNKLSKEVAAKLQTRMDQLNLLLSLSGSAGVLYNNSASSEVISNAQETLDKAFSFITRNRSRGNAFRTALKEIVASLESAVGSLSELLRDKVLLAKPIQLADLVANTAGKVRAHQSLYEESRALKLKAERVGRLLWKTARTDLYERPIRRIMVDTTETLYRALWLVNKCRAQGNLVRRVFTHIPVNAFMEIPLELDNTINNISWLIRVSMFSASASEDDEDIYSNLGLPPIASKEPILCPVWKQVAKLLKGSPEDKANAATALTSITDMNRIGKIIVEEGGLEPLLKLVKEGTVEAQESAACALGMISGDPECAEVMVQSGDACSIFTDALKKGPVVVQVMVAWAVYELVAHYPACQDTFAQNNAVEILVEHILCENEVAPVNCRYCINEDVDDGEYDVDADEALDPQFIECNHRSPQLQYASDLKVLSTRALGKLASENSTICRSIVDSRLMPHFHVLLQNAPHELQYNTAWILTEIARVAEVDDDLRCYAFNTTSDAATAVVEQLMRIIGDAEYNDLLVPCVVTLGCLSEIFSRTEVIRLLARLLDDQDDEVVREATIALVKFAWKENHMQKRHCKAIVAEVGVERLVRLVRRTVQKPALVLMCLVTIHHTENEKLQKQWVINVLEWAATQVALVDDDAVDRLLKEAKAKLVKVLAAKWDRRDSHSLEDVDVEDNAAGTSDESEQQIDGQVIHSPEGELEAYEETLQQNHQMKRATSIPQEERPKVVDRLEAPRRAASVTETRMNNGETREMPTFDELTARFNALRRELFVLDGLDSDVSDYNESDYDEPDYDTHVETTDANDDTAIRSQGMNQQNDSPELHYFEDANNGETREMPTFDELTDRFNSLMREQLFVWDGSDSDVSDYDEPDYDEHVETTDANDDTAIRSEGMNQQNDSPELHYFENAREEDEQSDEIDRLLIGRAISLPHWDRPKPATAPSRAVSSYDPFPDTGYWLTDYDAFAARFRALKRR